MRSNGSTGPNQWYQGLGSIGARYTSGSSAGASKALGDEVAACPGATARGRQEICPCSLETDRGIAPVCCRETKCRAVTVTAASSAATANDADVNIPGCGGDGIACRAYRGELNDGRSYIGADGYRRVDGSRIRNGSGAISGESNPNEKARQGGRVESVAEIRVHAGGRCRRAKDESEQYRERTLHISTPESKLARGSLSNKTMVTTGE